MKNVSVWSRSRLFLPGAGADPIWSEPESAPGPRTSGAGAAQKSGGSATLARKPTPEAKKTFKKLKGTGYLKPVHNLHLIQDLRN